MGVARWGRVRDPGQVLCGNELRARALGISGEKGGLRIGDETQGTSYSLSTLTTTYL